MAYSSPLGSSGGPLDAARSRRASRSRAKAKAIKKSSDSGGFLSDLVGGVSDLAPDLGLGNAANMLVGIPGGLYHLGTDWATKGLGKGDFGTYTNFAKGVGKSLADTVATAAKPLGGDFWYEKGVQGLTGYRPRDFIERSMDPHEGLLPAIINDVGNVALVGGAASKVLKAGDVGAVAGEQVAKEAALEAPGNAARAKALTKATTRLEKAKEAAGGVLPEGEAVANRVKALRVAHGAAHPYQTIFNKAIRPITSGAEAKAVAGAASEGATVAELTPEVKQARRALAEAEQGIGDTTVEQAKGNLATAVENVRQRAVQAGSLKPRTYDTEPTPKKGDVVVYHGQRPGGALGQGEDFFIADQTDEAGNVVLNGREYAAKQAGPGGTVYATTMPKDVYDIMANRTREQTGQMGTVLGPERAGSAVPVGEGAQAYELGDKAPPLNTEPIMGRNGPIEPETPAMSPKQQTYEALRRQRLENAPGWSKAVVDKLPEPIVRALSGVEHIIQAQEVQGVMRERARIVEAARRKAIQDPAIQTLVNDVGRPLVGEILPDGTKIDAAKASEMVGAEVMARLDGADMLTQAGGDGPILREAINQIASQGNRIPQELIDKLGLEEPLQNAVNDAMRMKDENVATLIGGRQGVKGLEGLAEDVPTMTRRQIAMWRQLQKLIKRRGSLEERGAVELEKLPGKIGEVGRAINKAFAEAEASHQEALDVEAGARALLSEDNPELSLEQLSARNKKLEGEGDFAALQRQRAISRSIERKHILEKRTAERNARAVELKKTQQQFAEILRTGQTTSHIEAAKVGTRVDKLGNRLATSLANPTTRNVPPVWQPIMETMTKLTEEAASDPHLAEAVATLPTSFEGVLKLAAERGFDPTHVRSFTPDQVERLVHETIRLGGPGRKAGEEFVAGTRNLRGKGIPATQSIEALAAATPEVVHEVQTNELVSHVQNNHAIEVVDGVIPPGYERWSPVRDMLRGPTESLPSGHGEVVSPPGTPEYAIPKQVGRVLRNMNKDFSHSAFRLLGKPSSWWRTYLLTLTPRWYVNNFVGNFALATAEGVTLRDWAKAWSSYRQRAEKGGPRQAAAFSDVPGVTGASVYHELEQPSLIPPREGARGLAEDLKKTPGFKGKWAQAKHRLARGNEVVDEIARAAVFHHNLRTTGRADIALQRSYEALVDYGDLGPMEQNLVRSVIPFYAWQKGVLKAVTKLGIEHPAAVAVMQRMSDLQNQVLKDQYGGDVPVAYQGIINTPGGAINTRGLNPFADAGQLVRANGIGESINPFVEAIVRNELNAPATTRPEDYRVNQFGSLVAETNVPQDITETFTSGLPQGQLIGNLTGNSPNTVPPSSLQAIERFGGVNAMSKEDLQRIIQRMAESEATLSGAKKTAKKAKRASSLGRAFTPTPYK